MKEIEAHQQNHINDIITKHFLNTTLDQLDTIQSFYDIGKNLSSTLLKIGYNDIRKIHNEALRAESVNDFKRALLFYSYLLFIDSDEWILGIANCLYFLNHEENSNKILDQINPEIQSNNYYLSFQIRRFLKEPSDLKKALFNIEKYIKNHRTPEQIKYISDIVFSQAPINEAKQIYNKHWRNEKNNIQLQLNAFKYFGYFQEARTFLLTKISKFDTTSIWINDYIDILISLGEKEKSLKFAKLHKSYNTIEQNNFMGSIAERTGNLELAYTYYEKSLLHGYSYTASLNIIRKCLGTRDFDRATKIFSTIEEDNSINQHEALNFFYLSRLNFYKGLPVFSLEAIEEALKSNIIKHTNLEAISKFFKIIYTAHANNIVEAYRLASKYLKEYSLYSSLNKETITQLKQTLLVFFSLKSKKSPRISNFSDIRFDKKAIEERINYSNKLIHDIMLRKNTWHFILNFQTGDTYLFLGLLTRFKKKLGDCNIEIYYPKRLKFICSLFKNQISHMHELPEEIDNWTIHSVFKSFSPGTPLLAHPHFLCRYYNGLSRGDNEDEDFITRLEIGLELNRHDSKKIYHPSFYSNETDKYSWLKRGVLLVPSSNSFRLMDIAFWNTLSKELLKNGYTIYENIGPEGQLGISGAIPLELNHSQVLPACYRIGKIIGIRSGFFDIVSGIFVDMDIIYPTPALSASWVENWKIAKFANVKSLREHTISYEQIDKSQYSQLISAIITHP